MTARVPLLAVAFALVAFAAPAQDKKTEKKDATKAKAAALANLKKADVGKTTVVETDHSVIASTLSEEKAKALGAVLEKVVPVARKSLGYEKDEEAWKGKLTFYYFPESRDFKSFVRNVIVDQPGGTHYALRADEPYVVDPVETTGKATEADQFATAAGTVAKALMRAKATGATLPDWLLDGFGRVSAARAEGLTSRRYTAYKTAARNAAVGKGGKPAALADLWAESRVQVGDPVAAGFADYLAYGPGAANLARLLSGFRPNDGGGTPTTPQALESAGWKDVPVLEKAWQKWITTGK